MARKKRCKPRHYHCYSWNYKQQKQKQKSSKKSSLTRKKKKSILSKQEKKAVISTPNCMLLVRRPPAGIKADNDLRSLSADTSLGPPPGYLNSPPPSVIQVIGLSSISCSFFRDRQSDILFDFLVIIQISSLDGQKWTSRRRTKRKKQGVQGGAAAPLCCR